MRRVRLVLIDERRRLVGVLVDIVRSPHDSVCPGLVGRTRQHHEIGRAAFNVERVVRLQWDKHCPAVALVHQIQAMVEELAEQREPLIEWRRAIGVHVRNNPVAIAVDCGGRRVAVRILVDNQIADDPRLGVDHCTAGLGVGRPEIRFAEHWIGHPREHPIRGAEVRLAWHHAVVRAVNRPQPKRKRRVLHRCAGFGELNLRENEIEV